jgi:hypothetical protein
MKSIAIGSCLVLAGAFALALGPGCGSSDPESTFVEPTPQPEAGPVSPMDPFGPASEAGTVEVDSGTNALDGGGCATATAVAKRIPVYMQFVVDGSGSMDGYTPSGVFIESEREADPLAPTRPSQPPGLTGKKWIAIRGALATFFDGLAANPDPTIAVGLYLFSSDAPKPSDEIDVPIAFVNASHATALKARLLPPVFPVGGTPLAASMNGQLPILKAFTPAAPVATGGKRVLVVMTDGIPTDGRQACLSAAASARSGNPSVLTFAVGVGNEDASPTLVYDEVFVGDLAAQGGTAPAGCNGSWSDNNRTGVPCHFQITPGTKTAAQIQADFTTAINKIRETVTSCELELAFNEGDVDPAKVNVVLKSSSGSTSQIYQDASNGWTYDNPSLPKKVILHGSACTSLKSDPGAEVSIVLGCKTLTPPQPN